MIPLPDLLHLTPHAIVDEAVLSEVLEMAFLGGDPGFRVEEALGEVWQLEERREKFLADLFLDDFIGGCLAHPVDPQRPVQRGFIKRVLADPPRDLETIRFRQGILRELATEEPMRRRTHDLYAALHRLLLLFKAPESGARIDYTTFRLEILEQARRIIDKMVDDFADAGSGLVRLAEVGREIQASGEYATLSQLLDYEGNLARLNVDLRIGADGKLRALAIRELSENDGNRFYRAPWKRWKDLVSLWWRRYPLDTKDVVGRTILEVYLKISPAIRPLLQVMVQLELYLSSLSFAELARRRGLEVCLAEVEEDARLELTRLFNPLLLAQPTVPVPSSVSSRDETGVIVVTGPNSGGKTRLLQAVGLAQLLGQSGLFAPAGAARLARVDGVFASFFTRPTAGEVEGHLGSELVRIRDLFAEVDGRALILLDELCSGTNPSEAAEIFSLVLRLLGESPALAFITTHFLDYAQGLAEEPPIERLEFLQVVVDRDLAPTYQFAPGVAETSLAAETARRLGVTFEELTGQRQQ